LIEKIVFCGKLGDTGRAAWPAADHKLAVLRETEDEDGDGAST